MSQTNTFYLPNLTGAAFRALLNQILAALADQNGGAVEPENPFAGMVWLDTGQNPPVFKLRSADNSGWVKIFTAETPPTKGQIGLGNVPNYTATGDLADGSDNKLLLASAGKTLQDSKLGRTAQAYDSARLGGKSASTYAEKAGTYPQLRAQGTTKDDVDLGNVLNYGITSTLTSNNSKQYFSAKGGYDLNQVKVDKSITVNGKALSGNITLSAANVGAFPASGGNLGGAINFTPDTGDIITLDGKSALRKTNKYGGMSLGCNYGLVLGSGLSHGKLAQNVDAKLQHTHISADYGVYIYTNLENGWDVRKRFDFQTDGGFLPANTAKTRQNLSVYSKSETYAKSEVYKKSETYAKSEVYKKSETYSRTEVDDKISDSGYELLDFGIVLSGRRYEKDNPFGQSPVITVTQIWIDNQWETVAQNSYDRQFYGAISGMHGKNNEKIVVTAAFTGIRRYSTKMADHTGRTIKRDVYSALCRVHVWKMGG